MSQDDFGDSDLSAASDGDSRTRSVRGAAEEKREKCSSSGCRLGCCCALFNLSPAARNPRISRFRGRCIWQLLIRSDGPSASHLSCFRPRAYASTLYLAYEPCPLATWCVNPQVTICKVTRIANRRRPASQMAFALAGSWPP